MLRECQSILFDTLLILSENCLGFSTTSKGGAAAEGRAPPLEVAQISKKYQNSIKKESFDILGALFDGLFGNFLATFWTLP